MRDLVLHLKTEYFNQVADGSKQFEYRLVKPYWEKRLLRQKYDRVVIWDAFKRGGPKTICIFPWNGYYQKTITHPHFGDKPVEVYAISLMGGKL